MNPTAKLIPFVTVLAVAGILLPALSAGEDPQEADLARARREKAAKVYDATLDGLKAPPEPGKKPSYSVHLETLYLWSRRWLEAEQDISDKKPDRLAAHEAHLKRMVVLARLAEVMLENGEFSHADRDAADFYRLEAEGWLKKTKARE